jgi:hypothetical protein
MSELSHLSDFQFTISRQSKFQAELLILCQYFFLHTGLILKTFWDERFVLTKQEAFGWGAVWLLTYVGSAIIRVQTCSISLWWPTHFSLLTQQSFQTRSPGATGSGSITNLLVQFFKIDRKFSFLAEFLFSGLNKLNPLPFQSGRKWTWFLNLIVFLFQVSWVCSCKT